MAFAQKALAKTHNGFIGLATGLVKNGTVSKHFYCTDDAAAVVEAAGYFNLARAQLRVGDIIEASMVNAGTPVGKGYVVTAVPAAPSNITIALQSATAG